MKSVLGTDLNPLPLKVGGAGEKSQGVTPQLMIYKYTLLHIQDGHAPQPFHRQGTKGP